MIHKPILLFNSLPPEIKLMIRKRKIVGRHSPQKWRKIIRKIALYDRVCEEAVEDSTKWLVRLSIFGSPSEFVGRLRGISPLWSLVGLVK